RSSADSRRYFVMAMAPTVAAHNETTTATRSNCTLSLNTRSSEAIIANARRPATIIELVLRHGRRLLSARPEETMATSLRRTTGVEPEFDTRHGAPPGATGDRSDG